MKLVHIPKMGMSTVEVDVLEVRVAPGQLVAVGDVLLEVEGDKTTFEVESEVAGTVAAIHVSEGETYTVGELALEIDDGG
jgi:pyruvate/2-oxoglutarate dehydrogenase complex dihydrolipoamide acyltransferase (E2) component